MRLSVGLLAHNEAGHIGATLDSLFAQTTFSDSGLRRLKVQSVEVLVVANGCIDDTARVAEDHRRNLPQRVSYRVIESPEAGKSRTWNRFVHELSDQSANFLILTDADIIFDRSDVIEQLLERLRADTHARVATDTPIKAFPNSRLSISDRASSAASNQVSKEGALCGQFYCARADVLRNIWLPPQLPVEDGFLAAMIKTNGFTSPADPTRIAWVPSARHFFRTHRSVRGYIAHETRIIVGSTINSWLYRELWEEGRNGHAGRVIKRRNAADADWLPKLIQANVREGGMWVVPAHFALWRLAPLRGCPLATKLRRAPVALAATMLNLVACLRANSILKSRDAASHW